MARTLSILAFVFAFFFPLLGLVLGIVALATKPKGERDGLALAAVIVSLVIFVISFLIVIIAVVAPLVLLGTVFGSHGFALNLCTSDASGIACVPNTASVNASTGLVQFEIMDGTGVPVNLTGLAVSGNASCALSSWDVLDANGTSVKHSTLEPGTPYVVEAMCGSLPAGQVFREVFTFSYDEPVGGINAAIAQSTRVDLVQKT